MHHGKAPPPCVATVPCTPQSLLTLVCLVLPLRQETWRLWGLVRDVAAQLLQGSRPGFAA